MKQMRTPGRPRSFEPDVALDAAMRVFWIRGFEGATLAALQEATGLTPPSLYSAFGSKEELYRRALDHYAVTFGFSLSAEGPVFAAVREFLYQAANTFADAGHPPGCMISTASLTVKDGLSAVFAQTSARRMVTVGVFRDRFTDALREGELPQDTDPMVLARYCGALVQGLSVQAIDGATAGELQKIVDIALRAWPTADTPSSVSETS